MPDNLTPEQRHLAMSRIKSKDTSLEKIVRSELHRLGLRFKKNDKRLSGKPDVVFPKAKVAVFIDGDFWHGWRYPQWKHKLAPFWQKKIEGNRTRDKRNFAKLRRQGWRVLRFWGHTVKEDVSKVADKIFKVVQSDS